MSKNQKKLVNEILKKHSIVYLLFLMLIGVLCCVAAWKPEISFNVQCKEDIAVKIYYDNQQEDLFDQLHCSQTFAVEGDNIGKIRVTVGNNKQIDSLRIDISETKEEVVLSNVKISYVPFFNGCIDAQQVLDGSSCANIQNIDVKEDGMCIHECGVDAYLYLPDIKAMISKAHFNVDWSFIIRFIVNILIVYICIRSHKTGKRIELERQTSRRRITLWITQAIWISFLIEAVCIPLINRFIIYVPFNYLKLYFLPTYTFSFSRCYFFFIVLLIISCIKNLGEEYVYKKRYWLVGVLLILLVIGKFSYSSINAYDLMLAGNTVDYKNPTILGRAQGIRADEWAIEKPYYFAQAADGVGFPYYNDNLMISGADMMVMAAAPVKDIMILTHPALLGFLFLPIEYAFSYYWNFRMILLFMSAFELGDILFKKRKYALALALSLLFSAPIQWTLSQWLIDVIIWGQVAVVIWFKLIVANKRVVRLWWTILLALAMNCYVYVMYPAAQVPFAYLFLVMVFIIAYLHKERKPFAVRMWGYYFIVGAIVAVFAGYFMYKSSTALNIMMNTVYPGQSRTWGTYAWDYELLPFMNLFISVYKDSPYLNNTETAQFIYFLPHIIIISVWLFKNSNRDVRIKTLLCLETIVLLLEVMTKIPERTFLSKYLLLDVSYPRRMQLVVGYGFFWIMWLIIDVLSDKKINISSIKKWNSILCIGTIFLVLYSPTLREYFKIGTSYIGTVSVFLLVGLYIYVGAWLFSARAHEKFVTVYVLVCILSTIWVNPVINGMDCIYEKSSVRAVQEIVQNDSEGRWITSGNAGIGNMLSSVGIKRCSGYYYYPDIDMMKIIDPNLKYIDLWNSFSAIDMRLTSGDNYVESENNDVALNVWINKETAQKLGIQYVFSIDYDYTDLEEKGELNLLYKDTVDNVSIYQIEYRK